MARKSAEVNPKEKPKKSAKKAGKPVNSKSNRRSVEKSFVKMGYMDVYDVITLIVGIWGIIWSIIAFEDAAATTIPNLTQAGLTTDASNNAWAALGIFIVQIYIYCSLALFPFFVNGGMKIINKWSDSFPLHFIKNKEDFRTFIVFLGWFCTLIFWVGAPSGLRIPHAVAFFVLIIVIFADAFRKKITKLPKKKIRE